MPIIKIVFLVFNPGVKDWVLLASCSARSEIVDFLESYLTHYAVNEVRTCSSRSDTTPITLPFCLFSFGLIIKSIISWLLFIASKYYIHGYAGLHILDLIVCGDRNVISSLLFAIEFLIVNREISVTASHDWRHSLNIWIRSCLTRDDSDSLVVSQVFLVSLAYLSECCEFQKRKRMRKWLVCWLDIFSR
jgi:hypothetical protein